jgi:hypothetical protein
MKHTPHELLIGMNPIVNITMPDDAIPAAQERLKQLDSARHDAQKALQRRIKPLLITKSFVSGDKVWLDALQPQGPSAIQKALSKEIRTIQHQGTGITCYLSTHSSHIAQDS